MVYSLNMPRCVLSGAGSRAELNGILEREHVSRALVMTDPGIWGTGILQKDIANFKADVLIINDVPSEPSKTQVETVYAQARAFDAQLVVAIGGGSVMDTAKIVAAMLVNPDFAADMLQPQRITKPSVPTVFIPTTAGTGSEATPNAIVLLEEKRIKQGIVYAGFIPNYVILDAELTRTVPPRIVASTGIDALCHAVETMISKKSNPLCRTFSLSAIQLIFQNLRACYTDPNDGIARENMLLAAFYGGVCINLSSTVGVHALSYPLGGAYHIAHGVSNAILLTEVMRFNLPACTAEFAAMADALAIGAGLSDTEKAELFVDAMHNLVQVVKIPTSLKEFHVPCEDIDALVESASQVTRLLSQNPREMSKDDIRGIYEKLF